MERALDMPRRAIGRRALRRAAQLALVALMLTSAACTAPSGAGGTGGSTRLVDMRFHARCRVPGSSSYEPAQSMVVRTQSGIWTTIPGPSSAFNPPPGYGGFGRNFTFPGDWTVPGYPPADQGSLLLGVNCTGEPFSGEPAHSSLNVVDLPAGATSHTIYLTIER